jgi:hypothetical protein
MDIFFLKIDRNGKISIMPVDARALVYRALEDGTGEVASDCFVNHWATCKNVEAIKAKKK